VGASFVFAAALTQKLWRPLIFVVLPLIVAAGYIRNGFASRIHQDPVGWTIGLILFSLPLLSIISAIFGVYAYFTKFKGDDVAEFYDEIRTAIRELS
jgi:hypothetical protein